MRLLKMVNSILLNISQYENERALRFPRNYPDGCRGGELSPTADPEVYKPDIS
jgi:hypothetical protein